MSQLPGAWSQPGYALVFERVQARAGLLAPSCVPAAEDGIHRAMVRAGCEDFSTYLARLATEERTFDDLITELTIGETYFFRTHEHFEYLRHHILPELTRLRGPEHLLRVWSAGCASGEEPYSLAVLLMEEGYGSRMEVLATDISRSALARAHKGDYGKWSLRGEAAERMRPFLRPEGKGYTLVPTLHERVRFGYLNLALDTWPSADSGIHDLDVIFCRNVLIYFTRPTIAAVARRLYDSLATGGFLITGPSDPSLLGLAPFEPLLTAWGIAWRRPLASTAQATPAPTLTSLSPPASPLPTPPPPAVLSPAGPAPATPADASAEPLVAPAPADAPVPAPAPAPAEAPAPGYTLPPDELEPARQALARGDWREAAQLAGALEKDPEAAMMAVRALANLEPEAAVRACAEAAARYPLSVELRYLESVLLLGLGRLGEAERAVRQALYLEPSLAVAHLTLGYVLRRLGDTAGALRAFRSTQSLCAAQPPDTPVPLAEGERAGTLADVARREWARLEAAENPEEG